MGLVFFPPSPRNIDVADALALAGRAPITMEKVAVFVDPTNDMIDAVMDRIPINAVQLHGDETPDRVAQIQRRVGVQIIKAIGVADSEDLAKAAAYEPVTNWLMFDAKAPADASRPGGMGDAFDWQLLAGRQWNRPWILSGGLTPENVGEAIRISGAEYVDVSSGVEDAPGKKSPRLIRAFIEAVTAADNTA
jgi:phosphoribosylanthranilate isomerase